MTSIQNIAQAVQTSSEYLYNQYLLSGKVYRNCDQRLYFYLPALFQQKDYFVKTDDFNPPTLPIAETGYKYEAQATYQLRENCFLYCFQACSGTRWVEKETGIWKQNVIQLFVGPVWKKAWTIIMHFKVETVSHTFKV